MTAVAAEVVRTVPVKTRSIEFEKDGSPAVRRAVKNRDESSEDGRSCRWCQVHAVRDAEYPIPPDTNAFCLA